ncbi:MAG: TonB-dependent receptor [Steroidobacteraceae bacterium]
MKPLKPAMVLGAAVFALGVGATDRAVAQSAAPAADQLEEVVVTAEKRATNLQKTSSSIEVKTGEQLRAEGKKRIDEIMKGTVGVAAQDSQVGVSFTIRGVASVEGGPPGGTITGTSIPVIIDGVAQSRGEVVRGGTLDVSQVEVMRGPQSTNVGAGAMAGAVSLVTNNPVFKYEANGLLEKGNYNLTNVEGVLNVPLTDDQALRLAYSTNKRDGYISAGAGDSDLLTARLKYRWKPSDNLDIVASLTHNSIGGNGVQQGVLLSTGHWAPYDYANPAFPMTANGLCSNTSNITVMGCPVQYYVVSDGVDFRHRADAWDDGFPADAWPNDPFRDTRVDSYSVQATWDVGFGTLTALPSYEHSTFRSMEPPRGLFYMSEDLVQNTKQVEVRLSSPSGGKLEWLGGLYYYDTNRFGAGSDFTSGANISYPGNSDMGVVCGTATTNPGNCYTWGGSKYSTMKTESAFGNFKYSLLDTLRLIGGLRYSSDKKAAVGSSSNVAGTAAGPGSAYTWAAEIAGKWSATTYRAGVEWDFLPDSMLYLTRSTGYQAGSASADPMGVVTVGPALKLNQTELGVKNRFFDQKLQLNVALFNSDYRNRPIEGQISALTAGSSSTTCTFAAAPGGPAPVLQANATCAQIAQNAATAPKLISRGVDLDVSWLPTSNDRIDWTLEYLDAKYNSQPSITGYGTSAFTAQNIIDAGGDAATAQELADSLNGQLNILGHGLLQNSPKYSSNFTYSHAFRLNSGASITPKVNWVYKQRYWSFGNGPGANLQSILADTSNLAWQQAYNTFDAYLGWDSADGRFTVNAYMKNVGNEVVLTNYGGSYVSLDAPRTFGVIFQASF